MKKTDNHNGWAIYLRLLQYVKPYWLYFIISVIGMMIFAASEPAFAKLLEYFTEELSSTESIKFLQNVTIFNQSGGFDAIWFIPFLVLSIACCRSAGAFIGGYFIGKIAYRVIHDLRKQLFNKLLHFPYEFYAKKNPGSIISVVTFSVSQITEASSEALRIIIREGMTVIFLFGFLLYTSWKMTLIFIAIIPLIAVAAVYASNRVRKVSRNIQNSMADITNIVKEAISGQEEVKIFNAQQKESDRFTTASENNYLQTLKMDKHSFLNTAALQFIVAIALSVLLFTVLLMKGQISAATLIGYVTAAALLPKPIKQLSDVNSKIQKGIAAAEIIFSILDKKTEDNSGNIKSAIKGHIEFKNVNFYYPDNKSPILKDINFTVEPGKTIAVVGRSGAGKTTLIKLLSRFYLSSTGSISIDGVDINDYNLNYLRSKIAVVSQKVTLFNTSIKENIAYGVNGDVSEAEIIEAAVKSYADPFIQKLPESYDTLVGDNGMLLSGGQKQRVAIARALLKDASIVILDEATSALDSDSETRIQSAIKSVCKNKTTIVIAHRLSTIENADTVLVMDKGKIIEAGTHQQLLKNNLTYANLYKLQFHNQAITNE
jgi:subfamily B ATP-binding cassette protein MsbA